MSLARGAVELDCVHLVGGVVVVEQPDLSDVVDEGVPVPALVIDVKLDVDYRHVDLGGDSLGIIELVKLILGN